MGAVFLSYAREDHDTAQRLAQDLELAGISVFWDTKLVPGEQWSRSIEIALRESQTVIVLWSSHSVESTWVRAEATEGLAQEKLFPVRIEPITPPMPFGQVHTFDLFPCETEAQWKETLNHLRETLPMIARSPRTGAPQAVRHASFDWKHALFSVEGRLSRREFWIFTVVAFSGCLLLQLVIDNLLSVPTHGASIDERARSFTVLYLAMLYPNFALVIKRFHDFDWSGWWTVPYMLLDLVGVFFFVVASALSRMNPPQGAGLTYSIAAAIALLSASLGFPRGSRGPNRYGLER